MINVIVHCSDSAWGNAAEITRWHLERKFATIGYHYVILNGKLSATKQHSYFDGHIETGRALDDDKDMELDEAGAHAFGYNRAVGICLIGKSNTFTQAQIGSLQFLIRKLRAQFGEIKVLQHSDVEPKKPFCAGFSKSQMDSFNI
jgi:N-acetylmuramoyl-L-alanine amidase